MLGKHRGTDLRKESKEKMQTLNLAIFWETFKVYFLSVNQKPVLTISREIYIPVNWHELRGTEMLKQSYYDQCWSAEHPQLSLNSPWYTVDSRD